MVRFSKKTDYAIQFLTACAEHAHTPLSAGEFARVTHISFLFIQQIAQDLRKAGFLEVKKGRQGGFVLMRSLDEITVQEIAETMEGAPSVVPCIASASQCSLSATCGSRKKFMNINQKIISLLSNITLAELHT